MSNNLLLDMVMVFMLVLVAILQLLELNDNLLKIGDKNVD